MSLCEVELISFFIYHLALQLLQALISTAVMQIEQLRELDIIPVAGSSAVSSISRTLLPFGWQEVCTTALTASNEDMVMLFQESAASGQLLPGRALAFEPRLAFVDLRCLW